MDGVWGAIYQLEGRKVCEYDDVIIEEGKAFFVTSFCIFDNEHWQLNNRYNFMHKKEVIDLQSLLYNINKLPRLQHKTDLVCYMLADTVGCNCTSL